MPKRHASNHPDRSVRSLARLEASGSTTRSLNLVAVWKRHGKEEDYLERPFFKNPVLNRSLVIKHRLRRHEDDILLTGRSTATKVVLPIDVTDLRSGARSFFVGERGYKQLLDGIWRNNSSTERDLDLALLELLDSLPSFDPFLMRERMSKSGYMPARCYFDLSEADAHRMFGFVRQEVEPLVGMSFQGRDSGIGEKTAKLAGKIMANASDAELDPLRTGMGMSRADFEEGVFCWKGFIYYKWSLAHMMPQVAPILAEISSVRPRGWTIEDVMAINAARARLTRAVTRACDKVRKTLEIYEAAYAELTRQGKPQAFRDFLIEAPRLFHDLGERLGAVQHIVSFWRYRFPLGRRPNLGPEDMIDLLADFQASLAIEEPPANAENVYLPIRA